MVRLQKHMTRALLAAALLTASSQQLFAAIPDVLDRVPDDADAVIVLKDLKTVSTKIANTATRLNLPVPPDPIGMLAQRVGIMRGLDLNGSVAAYISVPEKSDPQAGPPLVLLIPTTDAKGMLEGLNPSEPEKGISTVTLPNDNADTGYVATVGNYVALAQDKGLLEHLLASNSNITGKLTPMVKNAFENNDLVIFANVPHFAPRVIKSIEAFKPMLGMLVAMQNQGDPASAAIGVDIITGVLTGFEQVLGDTDAGVETLRLTDSGVTLGFGAHLRNGTPSGAFVAAQKPLASTALIGLPAGKYIIAAAGTWDPATMSQIVGFFGDILTKSPTIASSPNADKIKQNFEYQKQLITMTTGARVALYEPEQSGSGLFNVVVNYDVTDSAQYKDILRKAMPNSMLTSQAMEKNIDIKLDTKLDAFIAGNAVDQYKITYAAKEPLPAGASPDMVKTQVDQINKMWGPDGLTLLTSSFDNSSVMVMNGGQKLIEATIAATKDKSDSIGKLPEITAVSKQIVPNPIGVSYISIDRILGMIQKLKNDAAPAPANAVALGGPIQPVVISMGVEQSVLTSEIHMPISALGAIIQASQQH